MNEATTRTLTQMEKLVRNQHRDPGKVYMKTAGTGSADGFGGIGEIRHQYHREDCKRDPQSKDDGKGYQRSDCGSGS